MVEHRKRNRRGTQRLRWRSWERGPRSRSDTTSGWRARGQSGTVYLVQRQRTRPGSGFRARIFFELKPDATGIRFYQRAKDAKIVAQSAEDILVQFEGVTDVA